MVDKTLDVKDLSVAELYETLHEYEFLIKVRQALVIGNHTLTTINIRTNKLQQNQRINQSIYSRVSLGGNQLPEIEEASEGSFYRHHAAEQAINGLLRKEHVQPEILMNGKVYYFGNYYIGDAGVDALVKALKVCIQLLCCLCILKMATHMLSAPTHTLGVF